MSQNEWTDHEPGAAGVRVDCFPTAIWRFQLDEALRAPLERVILQEKERDPTGLEGRSTLLGWHSRNDLHKRAEMADFVTALNAKIGEVARAYALDERQARLELMTCWALVNGKHATGAAHCHPNAFLSGVYYVATPPDSGAIHFQDPRPAAQMAAAPVTKYAPWTVRQITYQPTAGTLLIFPSWLVHSVGPTLSESPRISVSFNYRLVFNPI